MKSDHMLMACKILAAAWWRGRWSCFAAGSSLTILAVGACLVVLGGQELPGFSPESVGTVMRLEGYAFGTGFTLAILLPWFSTTRGPTASSLWIAFLFTVGIMSLMLLGTKPGWITMLQYFLLVGM
ncbi:MAG: hypothetical protein KKG53_12840, partial [Proteobacteria bacterium]|nr:hypothetical protein [Pseudomonadota bacterium]